MPGLLGDRAFFDLSGTESGGWSVQGFAQLQSSGKITVTIDSLLGDFYLGDSTLTVNGNSPYTVRQKVAVPEPGTLGLMGLGLLGVAFAMGSRRKQAGTC